MGEVEEAVSDIVGGDGDDGKKDPRVERLNTIISAAVALVATFLAISNVKDGNICQAMQKAQAMQNDAWAFYQAKSTKGHIAEGVIAELEMMRAGAPAEEQKRYGEQIDSWKQKLAGYETQKAEIKTSAEGYGAEYDRLNNRDDQFDMSE